MYALMLDYLMQKRGGIELDEKAFNLLDEPWILITDGYGKDKELSLLEVFLQAHEIKTLSGELPAQDAAILRLLLGVLYSVFTNVNEAGEPLNEEHDALALWKRLWELKCFPIKVITGYFEHYRDRFWLVHPERPFYQVAGLSKGTNYSASKLIGDLSESSNKKRLFQNRSGKDKDSLEFSQAARWLIHLNAFDDTSSKASVRGMNMPSPGAGWLGKLGIVYAVGDNLFETLMFNLVLLDERGQKWGKGNAAWELKEPRSAERIEIPLPHNQAALMTLQSRRILLERSNDMISGFILLGGDFFQKENAFSEQMTLWRRKDEKKDEYVPKRHNSTRQFWRDFTPMFAKTDKTRPPGIINWLARLRFAGLIQSRHVQMCAVSIQYGDKDFFVVDTWEDSITLNADLLSALGDDWINRITDSLEVTDKMVYTLGSLAADIAISSGDSGGLASKRKLAREEAYFALDMPFRKWLADISPESDIIDETCNVWEKTAQGIVLNYGEYLFSQAGTQAFTGREKDNTLYTAPKAHIWFKNRISKILWENKEKSARGNEYD